MLYRAIYKAGNDYHAMTYFGWDDVEAVAFAERFVERLTPWYNDAVLTHVVAAKPAMHVTGRLL